MIKITISTSSWARRYLPQAVTVAEFSQPVTAYSAVIAAGLPDDEIGFMAVAGKLVLHDYMLQDGDVLTVHPLIIGG